MPDDCTAGCSRRRRPRRDCYLQLKAAVRPALRAFLVAYGLKAGIRLLLFLRLAVVGPHGYSARISTLRLLRHALLSAPAWRSGYFAGFAVAIYTFLRPAQPELSAIASPGVAGALAGLAMAAADPDSRTVLAQQACSRALQTGFAQFAIACSKSRFARLGPAPQTATALAATKGGDEEGARDPFFASDVMLFCASSAQLMYSFAMRREALAPDFFSFMRRLSMIPASVLALNASATRASGNGVGCGVLHAGSASCVRHSASLARSVFIRIFPVYFALHAVPYVIFQPKSFIKSPLHNLKRLLQKTVRSAVFLVCFVAGFQAQVCLYRNLRAALGVRGAGGRWQYAVFGFVSGLSLYIENCRSRRCELALYAFPKAARALYLISMQKSGLPWPGLYSRVLEVAAFAVSSSIVMRQYEIEKGSDVPGAQSLISPAVRLFLRHMIPASK